MKLVKMKRRKSELLSVLPGDIKQYLHKRKMCVLLKCIGVDVLITIIYVFGRGYSNLLWNEIIHICVLFSLLSTPWLSKNTLNTLFLTSWRGVIVDICIKSGIGVRNLGRLTRQYAQVDTIIILVIKKDNGEIIEKEILSTNEKEIKNYIQNHGNSENFVCEYCVGDVVYFFSAFKELLVNHNRKIEKNRCVVCGTENPKENNMCLVCGHSLIKFEE